MLPVKGTLPCKIFCKCGCSRHLFREWGFPAALILAWVVTTAYSISIMAAVTRPPVPAGAHREEPRV